LQMEEGLSAIIKPFSLRNPLVKYTAMGLRPRLVKKAISRLLEELQKEKVLDSTIQDVQRFLETGPLLQDALEVCTS
jgi:hypothetical protein